MKYSRLLAAAAAPALLLGAMAPAFADNIHDDVAASGPTEITLNGGTASTTIKYYVQAAAGCDIASTPSVWKVDVTGSAGVTANPSTVSFDACDVRKSVAFTATSAGVRSVTLSHVSGPDLGGSNAANPARFDLTVNAATNTAPEVSVGGVADGESYEFGAVPTVSCSVTDAETPNPVVPQPTVSPISGLTAYGLGTWKATCTYTDPEGLTDTATATYSIVDTQKPVLNTPGDIALEATGQDGEATWTGPSASDNVALAGPATCDETSPHTFDLGTHTIDCSVTDVAGNTATGSFKVTVSDTTGPSLSVSSDVTVEATGPGGALATYDGPTASDLYDGPLSASCSPASGSTFELGSTPVSCSATDSSGNTANAGFSVHVRDTTPPAVPSPPTRLSRRPDPAVRR